MAIRETNPFDAPVAGQSLTDTPKNYPWEHAPQYATVEDASMQVWDGLHNEATMQKVLVLLEAGLTVEEITKVIVFAGFVEGKFTPDTGLLLTPIVAQMIMAIGKSAGIEKININKPKQDDTKELIRTVIKSTPKEVDEKKEMKDETPDTGLMGKPKKEEK
tara:strand:+ start:196 stop:678 length:483 start_codon:yes stop_codon:yes gene_type:complete